MNACFHLIENHQDLRRLRRVESRSSLLLTVGPPSHSRGTWMRDYVLRRFQDGAHLRSHQRSERTGLTQPVNHRLGVVVARYELRCQCVASP